MFITLVIMMVFSMSNLSNQIVIHNLLFQLYLNKLLKVYVFLYIKKTRQMVISCLNLFFCVSPPGLLPPFFFSILHPPLKLLFLHSIASEKVEISFDSFLLLLR